MGRGSRAAGRGAGREMFARGCRRAVSLANPHEDDLEWRVHAGAADRQTKAGRGPHRRAQHRGQQEARDGAAAVSEELRWHGGGHARHERGVRAFLRCQPDGALRTDRVRRSECPAGPVRVRRPTALRPRQPAISCWSPCDRARPIVGSDGEIESLQPARES